MQKKEGLGVIFAILGLPVVALLVIAMLVTTNWSFPPIDESQTGYRGTSMMTLKDRGQEADFRETVVVPEEPWELELPAEGEELAGDLYENLQVLGHLGDDQFNRLMTAITEWVSPEEGCVYCHNPENFASDDIYTKIVARRMIQMTQTINADWQDHVGDVGVTCYTCHRGQHVPENLWFTADPEAYPFGRGQNKAEPASQYASLPTDPFTPFLLNDAEIRLQAGQALPGSQAVYGTMQTEWTYSLMNHMAAGLGVNCTFCHNSRAWFNWEESPPQRTTAWYGIRMARSINQEFMHPLGPQYPENRVGELGDGGKANCATCHAGVNKPLYGAPMAQSYPSLLTPAPAE